LIFGLADRTVSLTSGAGAMVRRIGYACVPDGIKGQTQLFLENRLNLWLVTWQADLYSRESRRRSAIDSQGYAIPFALSNRSAIPYP
jgi:hypothetical protein